MARGNVPFVPPLLSSSSTSPLLPSRYRSHFVSTALLLVVVAWATTLHLLYLIPKWLYSKQRPTYDWDVPPQPPSKVTKDVAHYAREIGHDIQDETVETQDGFLLRVHRVLNPTSDSQPHHGFPILILHGLFQCSGCFITSEDRSLAFYLSKKGYQVFLGNNRGVFDMGHARYARQDPRFWDWTIHELALYDFPAMVEWVCDTTGYNKIAVIAHSQGAGAGFISLSQGMRPDIGEKISCFITLAPAVYAGPLTQGWLFQVLARLDWPSWKSLFGPEDFIPIMTWAYNHVPLTLFTSAGYIMFSYLFSWTDANWLLRRKPKMFRFTPTPVSSASIFWWCGKGGFAQRGCSMDPGVPRWFDTRFPPLSIYYGGRDYLVDTLSLLHRLKTHEMDSVNLVRVKQLESAEHCDFYYAAEALEWCFGLLIEDIERTRPTQHVGDLITT